MEKAIDQPDMAGTHFKGFAFGNLGLFGHDRVIAP